MNLSTIVGWMAGLLQLPLLVAWLVLSGYLVFLTASAAVGRVCRRGPALAPAPTTRFSILVPAHNESLVIGACLASLAGLDYPATRQRVLVIADNCVDTTADIARRAGATVYQRDDPERRGKGYALNWAIPRLLAEDGGWTDAVVIFDADTRVDAQFLRHLDAGVRRGSQAIQGRYDLLDPFHNWRTALLYSALLLYNRVRTLARDTWGWTNLLKGNGMCFTRPVVERFGWNAYSLAEDIEFTTTLLHAGIRVDSAPGAVLYAQAPETAQQADSQRMRWEGGRFALARRDGSRLMREAARERSLAKLDWAIDLLIPPLAILVGVPGILLVAGALLTLLGWGLAPLTAVWALALLGICFYVLGGMVIGGAAPRAYLYLLATPLLLLWKVRIYALMLLGRGARGWVRTERVPMREAK